MGILKNITSSENITVATNLLPQPQAVAASPSNSALSSATEVLLQSNAAIHDDANQSSANTSIDSGKKFKIVIFY